MLWAVSPDAQEDASILSSINFILLGRKTSRENVKAYSRRSLNLFDSEVVKLSPKSDNIVLFQMTQSSKTMHLKDYSRVPVTAVGIEVSESHSLSFP